MSVSRQALLQWVNELLQLNYTKLDQLGTGAAYCQIMDSIYGDVPMAKVKFDSNAAYDHQTNFKVLQAVFTKHKIGRSFDPIRLMKCRLQDNLEFVQWMYKFWEDNAPKGDYDPTAHRKAGAPSRLSMAPGNRASSRAASSVAVRPARSPAMPASATTINTPGGGAAGAGRAASRAQSRMNRSSLAHGLTPSLPPQQQQLRGPDPRILELEGQIEELERTINVVTTERTLYYGKLLEIEELLQNRLNSLYADKGDSLNDQEPQVELVRTIQSILYATAEGFETPYRPEDEPF